MAGENGLRVGRRLLPLVAAAGLLCACSQNRPDMDLMVWSKPGWNPKQEDADYVACLDHGKKAATRRSYWKRLALSRQAENPPPNKSPADIMHALHELAIEDREASQEIAADCMVSRGYQLKRIDQAQGWR